MTSKTEVSDRFPTLINALLANGDLRVWSVIVTAFGDLAYARGDQISGPCLTRLTRPMGIKPEALRVALFRLKKDGWTTAKKSGRQSLYQLSAHGFTETNTARRRIYGAARPSPKTWRLCIAPPQNNMLKEASLSLGQIEIRPGIFLMTTPGGTPPNGWLHLEGSLGDMPDWVAENIAPLGTKEALAALEIALGHILELIEGENVLSANEIAMARILIVHQWRRIILRLPDVPDQIYGSGWHLSACRLLVKTLLERLVRPPLKVLETF